MLIPLKLDTGAQVNLLSEKQYAKLQRRPKIHHATVKVTGYSGVNIPVTGCCITKVTHKSKTYHVAFLIVKLDNAQSIIGLKTCSKLNLIQRVAQVTADVLASTYEWLLLTWLSGYQEVSERLDCSPGKHKIEIEENASPVVNACRKVPFQLRDKLKAELDHMVSLQVIQKIEGPTEWVNSLVIITKSNGQWVYLDPEGLNKVGK